MDKTSAFLGPQMAAMVPGVTSSFCAGVYDFLVPKLDAQGHIPGCSNDDGSTTSNDILYVANFLFLGGSPPSSPYPDCGLDPTEDSLDCSDHPCQGTLKEPVIEKKARVKKVGR